MKTRPHILRKKKHLIAFILINIILLVIYLKEASYPYMVYQSSLGELVKDILGVRASMQSYFYLARENELLRLENERLRNAQSGNFLVDYRDSSLGNRSKIFLDEADVSAENNTPTRKFLWIRTRVIQTITQLGNHSLIVGVGAVDGIRRGMPVIGTEGLIGKIIKVYPEYSLVATFFHSEFSLAAKKGKNGASGILRWEPSNFFDLTLSEIPVSDSTKVGDSIYTSHLSYHIPDGILIGIVAQVNRVDNDHDNLLIAPVEKITQSRSVYVIRDEQKEPSEEGNHLTY